MPKAAVPKENTALQRPARRRLGICGGLEPIAPFLDKGYLPALAKEALQKGDFKGVADVAPFFGRDILSEVMEKYL